MNRFIAVVAVALIAGCSQKTTPIGKPDALVKLCGGEHYLMVTKIWATSFEDNNWVICEVDTAGEDSSVYWKSIAVENYPGALASGSLLDKSTRAISVGIYQLGDQRYEAYDCGDSAR